MNKNTYFVGLIGSQILGAIAVALVIFGVLSDAIDFVRILKDAENAPQGIVKLIEFIVALPTWLLICLSLAALWWQGHIGWLASNALVEMQTEVARQKKLSAQFEEDSTGIHEIRDHQNKLEAALNEHLTDITAAMQKSLEKAALLAVHAQSIQSAERNNFRLHSAIKSFLTHKRWDLLEPALNESNLTVAALNKKILIDTVMPEDAFFHDPTEGSQITDTQREQIKSAFQRSYILTHSIHEARRAAKIETNRNLTFGPTRKLGPPKKN